MIKIPTPQLQTDKNCVAYAIAYAIEVQLAKYPPEYWKPVNRAYIEGITGAPTTVNLAVKAITAAIPWVYSLPLIGPVTTQSGDAIVAATWRDGISHAIVLLPEGQEYDPAKGAVQPHYGATKCNNHILIQVRNPPVVNKWRRYALYRWLEKQFN